MYMYMFTAISVQPLLNGGSIHSCIYMSITNHSNYYYGFVLWYQRLVIAE